MKRSLKFFLSFFAAVLFGWGVYAQNPARNRPVEPLPLEEKSNEDSGSLSGIDKWNAEGKLFLSLYGQYQAKHAKSKKIEKRLQSDFGMQRVSENKSRRDFLPVFLEYDGEEALAQAESLGFKVQTRLEGICTGLIPVDVAEKISDIEGIVRISASLTNKVHNDKSRTANKVDKVQESYAASGLRQSYDGTGVILGIIDIGFDYTHPTFYTDASDKSTYRVKKVWDQGATTGTRPSGFTYGAEYSGTDAILAAAHDQDKTGTHATHVAGTAGGSGAGTIYKGMAPGTDLVFVPTNMSNAGIFDGISYIEKYAAAQGKPCVVNMSLGSDIGPHDGTSAFDLACDQIVRNGFVLVGSAGNSGDTKLHYQAGVAKGKSASSYLTLEDTEDIYIDCWSNNKKHFVVFVAVMENGQNIAYISYRTNQSGGEKQIKSGSTVLATVNATCETNSRNNQPHVIMVLDASTAHEKGYDMMVQFQAIDDSVGIHAWINPGEFDSGNTDYTHNASISAGNSVLSVAAYNTRTTWQNSLGDGYRYTAIGNENDISSFSSRGPLANGVNKPDIAAPGAGIISAGNSYNAAYIAESRLIAKTKTGGKDYPWVLEQGTSMSSPAMAGIVALFLQKDATLDIAGVKEVLSQTAYNDSYTGLSARTEPNPTWGYGKVNALSALVYLEEKDVTDKVTITIAQTPGGIVSAYRAADDFELASGDEVSKGTLLYLLAEPEKDHVFVSWWDGDTEDFREYEAEGDVTVSAIFEARSEPEKAIVQIVQNNGGTVSVRCGQESVTSGSSLPVGSELTLEAEAGEGYLFVSWWDGDKNPFRTYMLNEDVTVSATFEARQTEEAIVHISQNSGGTVQVNRGQETVESGAALPPGSALTLRAVPDEGYRFVAWWDGNTNKLRSYVLNGDVTISATFERDQAIVRIEQHAGGTVQVNRGQETVESGSLLPLGSALTLRAVPDEGYRFVAWWDGNTNKLRSYVLNESVTVSADFEKTTAVESWQEEIFRIYPNPTDGHVAVSSPVSARIEVLSAVGARLYGFEVRKGEIYDIDLSGEPAGVYYLRLVGKDKVSVFKILRR